MKRNNSFNSLQQFHLLKNEIDKIKEDLKHRDLHVVEIILMEEREVLQFLKVSKNTLVNYRKKYQLKPYNVFGRTYYLKHEFYETILNQLVQ